VLIPIYLRKRAGKGALVILIGTQAIYSVLAMSINFLIFKNPRLHSFFLFIAFFYATYSASVYYFETFAEIYIKKLEKEIQKINEPNPKVGSYFPPLASVATFFIFLFFSLCLVVYLQDIYLVDPIVQCST